MINLNKQEKIMIILIGAIIISFIFYYMIQKGNNNEENIEIETQIIKEEEIAEEKVVVHIAGCVKNKGIVEAKQGSRISDIIDLAGGLAEDADLTDINLAYKVEDGQKINIPSIYDVEDKEIIQETGKDQSFEEENKISIVNINTAKQTELETLPGIGPTISSRIIQYREENGKFKNIEDLKQVEGIGEVKWGQIKEYIKI